MTDKYAELRRLAEAATKGPWYFVTSEGADFTVIADVPNVEPGKVAWGHEIIGTSEWMRACDSDLEYIAACDPTTIAALCRANLRLVAMEQARDEARTEAEDEADRAERAGRLASVRFIESRTAEILASMEKQD